MFEDQVDHRHETLFASLIRSAEPFTPSLLPRRNSRTAKAAGG